MKEKAYQVGSSSDQEWRGEDDGMFAGIGENQADAALHSPEHVWGRAAPRCQTLDFWTIPWQEA